jgi:hypothetical protein
MKWHLIFEQSRIYGGVYNGDQLPQLFHIPVKDSWLQKRLAYVRQQQRTDFLDESRKYSDRRKN